MMNIMYRKILRHLFAVLIAFLVPVFAFAAPASLREFAELVVSILQNIISILFVSLAVGLLYGVIVYFANSDNDKKRMEIKGYLLWGVIGIIVVMGIWGILGLLTESVFGTAPGIPQLTPPTP